MKGLPSEELKLLSLSLSLFASGEAFHEAVNHTGDLEQFGDEILTCLFGQIIECDCPIDLGARFAGGTFSVTEKLTKLGRRIALTTFRDIV